MSEDAHKYIMALKMYLLEELKPEQVNSSLTASGQPYDRELHTSMQTFLGFIQIRKDNTDSDVLRMQSCYIKRQ